MKYNETVKGNKEKELIIDFSYYGIDLVGEDGEIYMPLSTIAELMSSTYLSAIYANDEVYLVDVLDPYYFDAKSLYESETRTREMADFTYQDLCFTLDYMYGFPSKSLIGESIRKELLIYKLNAFTAKIADFSASIF